VPTSCILYVAVKAIMIDLCANSLPHVLHSCCVAVMVLQGSEYTTRDGNGVDSKEYVQTQKVYFIDVESIDNIKKDLFSGYKDVLLDGEKSGYATFGAYAIYDDDGGVLDGMLNEDDFKHTQVCIMWLRESLYLRLLCFRAPLIVTIAVV
jgi:hypothetical protein